MATAGARRGLVRAAPPPSPSGPSGSAATRERLVTAAVSALREVGFAGATAREIAARAGCNQSQVFYHFGSVTDLLLAGLDDVSARRMREYRDLLDGATTLPGLVEAAQQILLQDLAGGDVAVLTAMMTGAHTVPGLGAQVAERLAPWHDFAEEAVRRTLPRPLARLIPAREAAFALVAGLLGLELLTSLTGDQARAAAVFAWGRRVAVLLGLTGLMPRRSATPTDRRRTDAQ
jgi:AcrR family transcriptional regulator